MLRSIFSQGPQHFDKQLSNVFTIRVWVTNPIPATIQLPGITSGLFAESLYTFGPLHYEPLHVRASLHVQATHIPGRACTILANSLRRISLDAHQVRVSVQHAESSLIKQFALQAYGIRNPLTASRADDLTKILLRSSKREMISAQWFLMLLIKRKPRQACNLHTIRLSCVKQSPSWCPMASTFSLFWCSVDSASAAAEFN